MRRLSIVHTESDTGWGAQQQRILAEAMGLIGRGHEVTLVCPAEARLLAAAQERGVPAVALPIGRKRLKGLRAMIEWLKGNRRDIINTHGLTDAWIVALALLTLGRPCPMVHTRHAVTRVAANAANRWLLGRAASRILVPGEGERSALAGSIKFPTSEVVAVPAGAGPQPFSEDAELARVEAVYAAVAALA